MKKVIISIILTLLLTVVTTYPASAKTNFCEAGGEYHYVWGKGSVEAGDFNLIGRQTSNQDTGAVYFTFTTGNKIKGIINCTSFNGDEVRFYGDGSYWNGTAWISGYTISGYAEDGTPSSSDQFSLTWCKDGICTGFIYLNLTSGNIIVK